MLRKMQEAPQVYRPTTGPGSDSGLTVTELNHRLASGYTPWHCWESSEGRVWATRVYRGAEARDRQACGETLDADTPAQMAGLLGIRRNAS